MLQTWQIRYDHDGEEKKTFKKLGKKIGGKGGTRTSKVVTSAEKMLLMAMIISKDFSFKLSFLSIVAFSFLGCERIIGRHELDVSCQCFVSSFCEKPETRMKLERTGDAEAVGIVTKYSLIHLFVRLSSYRF